MAKIYLCLLVVAVLRVADCLNALNVVVQDLGCWKEDPKDYVFPSLEGKHDLLDGTYDTRIDPLQKCAKVAQQMGFEMFALRDGGVCATGPMLEREFTRHGPSKECDIDGRGGILANQVYLVNKIIDAKYTLLGCFRNHVKNVESPEGRFVSLMDDYKTREEAVEKCARAAASLGHLIFGVVDGGFCYLWNLNITGTKYYPRSDECGEDGKGDENALNIYHINYLTNITIVNLGCFGSSPLDPALPLLESRGDILGNKDHKVRDIERCAIYNADWSRDKKHGKIFGITDGGACAGQLSPWNEYDRMGPSRHCPMDGRGSLEGMQIYKFTTEVKNITFEPFQPLEPIYLSHLGCWKYHLENPEVYLIPTLEGTDPNLSPSVRENPAQMCAKAARNRGFEIFALIEGKCYSSYNARELFHLYGPAEECDKELGGENSMSVYEIGIIRDPWISNEGCFANDQELLVSLEGTIPMLDGNPKSRSRAVQKCSVVAAILKYSHFALLDGGECYGLREENIRDFVPSSACSDNGEGGRSAIQLYKIKATNNFTLQNLGCWKDDAFRRIPLAEGATLELSGRYNRRQDAIGACARYARSRGFKVFALQAGGMCMTSENADQVYNWHGWSQNCMKDGMGGTWANQVYRIHEDWWSSTVEWWKVPEPWKKFGGWNCTWQWWKTPEAPFL